MPSQTQKQKNNHEIERPPVVVVLGHVDHGKSTLLDYIRKTNVTEGEAGGITQHTYAYEIIHKDGEKKDRKITFLDTPGHEAFSLMRERGANVADIGILVVSADDGVKKQTIEAIDIILKKKLPFIVAVTKLDTQGANVERVKQGLAEHNVFVEGYGGDTPAIPVSSKTGAGIPELLDMVLLVADLAELTGDATKPAEGYVIESHRDAKRGVSATLVIKNGTMKKGSHVASSGTFSPLRRIEDFLGKPIDEATFSSPVRIMGWSSAPRIGAPFLTFATKKDSEEYAETQAKNENKIREVQKAHTEINEEGEKVATIPLVIKADAVGTLEAIISEIHKMRPERVHFFIIETSVGTISEADIKRAASSKEAGDATLVIGFNVEIETRAQALADRLEIPIKTFDIIYRLTEWLGEQALTRRPKVKVEEVVGKAKIIRVFSSTKSKHVVGGKVTEGKLLTGKTVRILRRNVAIDTGKIFELQQKKVKTQEVPEGLEFGALIETKYTPAPGDVLELFVVVEK